MFFAAYQTDLYDDREEAERSLVRKDLYHLSSQQPLVLFYESASVSAYVLPNLTVVLHATGDAADGICVPANTKAATVESFVLPLLDRSDASFPVVSVVSVYALPPVKDGYLESVDSMFGRRAGGVCLFKRVPVDLLNALNAAMFIMRNTTVSTFERRRESAAAELPREPEEQEVEGVTPLPPTFTPLMADDGGVEETKHGLP